MADEQQSPTRVLVIDDDVRTRYVFRRILTHAGYSVDEAETGTEGLAKAANDPDVIISDVNLPDMLGYDLCRRLKAGPRTAAIPVLQISASFVSDESKVQALQGGADSYLVQPVDPAVLLAQMQALLRLRKAESQSSLSARQWQATFDSLTDGLALIDAEGNVVRTNRMFLGMLSLAASEAEGHPASLLFEQAFNTPFADFVERHAGHPTELLCGDDWYRVRYDEIQGDPAQSSGSVLLLTRITDYKKMQETLKMSERLAATGRLAHIIAHEINNPLESLSNLLYLMETTDGLSTELQGYLFQSTNELERISQITKQILAYHRDSKDPLPADAGELMQGVLAMFRSRMIGTGVELQTRFGCTRPIRIHPGEVRQAFGNLIVNALDAMGEHGGMLRVRCLDTTDWTTETQGVRFVISDSGTGISDALLPQIFAAFFTTKDVKGSGIGLWLTSEIVAKHRGRVRVRSRDHGPYRGTLFDIFLPSN
jgi:signal transduction histidine kinase